MKGTITVIKGIWLIASEGKVYEIHDDFKLTWAINNSGKEMEFIIAKCYTGGRMNHDTMSYETYYIEMAVPVGTNVEVYLKTMMTMPVVTYTLTDTETAIQKQFNIDYGKTKI
jgi:hypothetical protein